jgi:hypothetical protein
MLRPLGLAGMPVRSATVPRRCSTCSGAYGGAYDSALSSEDPLRPEWAEFEEAEEPSPRAEASAGDDRVEDEGEEIEGEEVEEDMGVFIGRGKRGCEERVRQGISAR